MRFFGRYEHALDVKGRVILPAKFRPEFAEGGGYITQYKGGCLALWTAAEFDRQMDSLAERQSEGASQRNLARVFAAGTSEAEVDKQGRMPIPPHLRSFAQLSSEVLVNGAIDRIELWSPAVWAERTAGAERALMTDDD